MGGARRAHGRGGAGAPGKGCSGDAIAAGGAQEPIPAASGQAGVEPSAQGLTRLRTRS